MTYQATAGAGNGLIKSRDFVNLRCWHQCRKGQIVETESPAKSSSDLESLNEKDASPTNTPPNRMVKSLSITRIHETYQKEAAPEFGLSKSLGASAFYADDDICSGDDDPFTDAEDESSENAPKHGFDGNAALSSDNLYVSSAISIEHPKMPMSPKYIRYIIVKFYNHRSFLN